MQEYNILCKSTLVGAEWLILQDAVSSSMLEKSPGFTVEQVACIKDGLSRIGTNRKCYHRMI